MAGVPVAAGRGYGRALVDVALDCGYADQGHLCRETRALADATPTELVAS